MRLLAQKDPAAWMAMSAQDRLVEGAKAAADSMIAEVKLKQKAVGLQIAAHQRIDSTLAETFDALPADAEPGARLNALSQMVAFDAKGGKFQSADTWAHSISTEALGELMDVWKSTKGFFGLFENRQGVRDLVHELWGEDSGNAAAKQGAAIWRTVTDKMRDRANASAMGIGELDKDAWHYPQSWSQARVAGSDGGEALKDPAAALANWTQKILPKLDRGHYLNEDGSRMTDADISSKVLAPAFDSITTDGQNKRKLGGIPGAEGAGSISRLDEHRVLFFKSADDYLAAQGDFGERTLWKTMTGHIQGLSREIALAETMGPKAEQTFNYFNDRTLLEELRDAPQNDAKIRKAYGFNKALYDYVSGHRQVVDQRVADAGQAFRNFETMTKLPRVVITALGDEAGMAATAFANRVPWSEVLMRELTYLNPANGEDRSTAAHAGLGINTMIGGLNRFGYEDLNLDAGRGFWAGAREATSIGATATLHATGAETMWDARRRALGSVLMSYLGNNVGKFDHLDDAHFNDVGFLKMKGITDADWQVWRQAEPEDWGMKHGVLTPKSINAIPDEKLAALGLGDDLDALRRHASTNLLGHILEETGMGVMDTGARQRAGMFLGTQAGTRGGELMRSAFLFKSFAYSMMKKHWERAAAMPEGSGNALFMGNGTAQYAATLVVTGTIMGAVATQLRNLAAGKDPSNVAGGPETAYLDPQFWGESFLRGGGLGFYWDFLYSEMTSHDTSLVPALMGPLATESEALWNLTGRAAFRAERGERTDEAGNAVRWGRGNLPVQNFWYLQAAFDHLIWNNMQEAVSPGYLDRMQAKAEATRGTSYYWDPHESLPTAAPDFGKMFQPDVGSEKVERMKQVADKALRPFTE